MKSRIFFLFLLIGFGNIFQMAAQSYLEREEMWIESTLAGMTLEEKIGQMMIVRTVSNGGLPERKRLADIIHKYNIGGVCFFQGDALTQVKNTNFFQGISKIPLFISIDGEWGLGMRHNNEAISFPKNLMLGAIREEKLIYQLGREIGKQCSALGVNFNFSPVVDINSNPLNPVIYERSFGESKNNVTAKSFLMFKGLEDSGVMACAKHFPGHGDTHEDSHHVLPVITHDLQRLEETELFPFRRLAAQNISSIMMGHLYLPAIDNRENRPASLSKKVVSGLLRENLGFKGLIITDAMDMKAVTQNFLPGIAEAEAVLAGNDIVLLPPSIPLAVQTILKYVNEGKISEDQINKSVSRILSAKYKLGLHVVPFTKEEGIAEALDNPGLQALKAKLVENSMTLIKDQKGIIPIMDTRDKHTATLSVNVIHKSSFQKRVDDYTVAHHYQLTLNQLALKKQSLINTFSQFDRLIVAIHSQLNTRNFKRDLPDELVQFLREIPSQTEVIIVFFGNPYMASRLEEFPSVLLAYDNGAIVQDFAAQALFGATFIKGKLPVKISMDLPLGYGIERESQERLGYGLPEMVGLSSEKLKEIDLLMSEMIQNGVTPGGQVTIAKDGKIVYNKSFGFLYPKGERVNKNTVYDVASLTKVLATTLSAMKLYEDNKLVMKRPLKNYISELINTNKSEINMEDVLAHQAGLVSFIPFYKETIVKNKKSFFPDTHFYRFTFSPEYSIPVSEKLFLRTDYRDSIWSKIYKSELLPTTKYLYSDIGFFLVQKTIEEITRLKLDEYVDQNFYQLMDLKFTGFKPLQKIPQSQIAPSEIDNYFRQTTLRGHVHDMAAAMLGGVAGHAGLFSTSLETTKIMQMLLNGGHYGGIRFLKTETIDYFTSRFTGSTRRGLGFDMKELNGNKTENMSSLASDSTFGHMGFTGAVTFADPEHQIVFTFLSNRTYPTMDNNALTTKSYRSRLQSVVYKALLP